MPVHQISVSPMGGSSINNSNNISANGVNKQSRSAGDSTNAVCRVPSVITCSNGGGGGIGASGTAYDSQTSSLSSNSYDICRICHCEGDSEVPLIAPCYCAGSLRYVHQVCLQQWIKSSNIRSCELCKFQFIMQTKTKPFSEWEHLEMSGFERRKLFCAVMFHAVALTCVVWSLYVLIERTADEIQRGVLEWPFWTKLVVVAIGFTGGTVFMYIQCKAYLQICQRWKAFNRVIYVQNAPEKTHQNLSPSHSTEKLQRQSVTAVHTSLATTSVTNDTNRQALEPTSSEFKPFQDGVRENHLCTSDFNHDRDETSIDLKGVRNLHIFFNDENRIHVQKERSPSCKIDLDDSEIMNSCNEYSSIVAGSNNGVINNNGQICPPDSQGSMSWHIKIGKTTSSSDRPENSDRNNGDARLPDLNQVQDENVISRNGSASNNLESPVLKLQIKKAEIVIKFGQKGTASSSVPTAGSVIVPSSTLPTTSSQSDTQVTEDNIKQSFNIEDNNESSVNIKFDNRENDNNEPIVIDLVQNQSNVITKMEHHLDNSTATTSSNPVQIRLDFGCKEINDSVVTRNNGSSSTEITMINKNPVKIIPSSSSSSQLLPLETVHSNRPSSDKPYCSRVVNNGNESSGSKSEPGSGSQSPLLTSRDDHKPL